MQCKYRERGTDSKRKTEIEKQAQRQKKKDYVSAREIKRDNVPVWGFISTEISASFLAEKTVCANI
jgi:hypothetical protein